MKNKLFLALLAVAFAVTPSFASVQNVKISGDVDTWYINRANFDLGAQDGIGGDISQSFFVTQTRLRVDADLTDNVSTTVALINERAWNNDPGSSSSGVDINLAYVTLREMLYSPLTVVLGRQVFAYGNSLVVDATGTNNASATDTGLNGIGDDLSKQSAMDAVRLIFDYKPLKLEFLYSKINTSTATAATTPLANDDIDLYGANATYELGDAMNTQVEGYFFAKIDRSAPGGAGANKKNQSDTVYVPGIRASTNPVEGLNVQAELAWQGGNKVVTTTGTTGNMKREAWAAQFLASYKVPVLEQYKPVANYAFTHVSGDSNPDNVDNGHARNASGETWTAWDPMFENQGGGTIYSAIFNLTNLNVHSVSLSANPIEDVTTKVTWSSVWLDKEFDDSTGAASTFSLVQPENKSIVN